MSIGLKHDCVVKQLVSTGSGMKVVKKSDASLLVCCLAQSLANLSSLGQRYTPCQTWFVSICQHKNSLFQIFQAPTMIASAVKDYIDSDGKSLPFFDRSQINNYEINNSID